MRFFVDIDKAISLHLEGAELLVFSALSLLASHKPWNGSAAELAAKSRCGSRDTAIRCAKKLAAKELIFLQVENGKCLTISIPTQIASQPTQNASQPTQNASQPTQIASVSRESTKENINNIFISESVSKDTHAHAHEVQDFDGSFYTPEAKPQSREEYNQYCKKLKCLVRTREYFWSWNDWKKWKRTEGDWRKALQWWMRNDELELEKEQSRR